LLTLLSLADRANKAHGGEAWPSLRDIATRTNRGERQVRSDLRILETYGWIKPVTSGRGGRGRCHRVSTEFRGDAVRDDGGKGGSSLPELRKIPGSLPPGFALPASICLQPRAN
jgi:hypothetical protein